MRERERVRESERESINLVNKKSEYSRFERAEDRERGGKRARE